MAGIIPNPKKRGYLLPKGFSDLIDVLEGKPKKPLFPGERPARINEQIQAPRVRVIDASGWLLGVMTAADALNLARSKGLDLLEIAPKAHPPVCIIVDCAARWRRPKIKT
jgi:hypothetical protein